MWRQGVQGPYQVCQPLHLQEAERLLLAVLIVVYHEFMNEDSACSSIVGSISIDANTFRPAVK